MWKAWPGSIPNFLVFPWWILWLMRRYQPSRATKNKRHFWETPRVWQGSLNYIPIFWWESNLMQIYGSFDGFLLKRTVPFFGLVSRVLGSRLPSFIKPKAIARITYFQVTLLTRCVTFYHGKSPFFTTVHHHFGKMFHIFSFLPTTKQANLSFSGGMIISPYRSPLGKTVAYRGFFLELGRPGRCLDPEAQRWCPGIKD